MLIKDLDSEGYEPPSRSRCRRIYDIANVLAMMNLVEKINHLFGTKKIPLFIYRGPEPFNGENEVHYKESNLWESKIFATRPCPTISNLFFFSAEPANSSIRMHEFFSRTCIRPSFSGISSTICSIHPPIPSPDIENSSKTLKNDFKDEEESLEKKRLSRKIKIENEKNSSSIPIPSTEENKNLINSNKRRKMNRVIPQQENRGEEKNNFNLPKPLPLHPSNISLPQQLVLYSTENIIPPQQQQMFLLPQTFPCSSNFYCWPTQQQQLQTQTSLKHQVLQNQLQTLQTFPLQSQTQILTSTTYLNKNKSPTKNLTKVRHSVHSILGFTQKENISSPNKKSSQQKEKIISSSSSSTLSPRAFRPPHQPIKNENNENINLYNKLEKNIPEGEEKSNTKSATKRIPFGQLN